MPTHRPTNRTASTPARPTGSGQDPTTPVRTCIGCRQRAWTGELLRLVADHEHHSVRVDVDRRLPGRGAHLHPTLACWEHAVRRRAFVRAFRAEGPFDTGALQAYLRESAAPSPATAPPAASAPPALRSTVTDPHEASKG